jgi:2-polyprenyl-3-methyl-5-hydroxy-6-metoxy-1,4-benzoquinol methylase
MPDRIADHYQRHAQAFDQARRNAFAERAWFDRFMAGTARGDAILDLGCGSGEPVARYLIDHGHQLTGVDAAENMIALARIRFARHHWVQGDMRSVQVDGQFAGVAAWDSLFHLPHDDQVAMIRRMAGWLAPGGKQLFNSGPERGVAIGTQFGEPLYHASLAPEEYRALFAELGLQEIAFAPEDRTAGGRSVWLAWKPG